MTRRTFLKTSVGASLIFPVSSISLLQSCKSPTSPQPDQKTPIALRMPAEISGGSLVAALNSVEIWAGQRSQIITINGNFIGSTIRVQKGDNLNLTFVNNLGEPSIIHWHGLDVPESMDGHPKYSIESGSSFQYNFPIMQRAGTYWYHAHPDKLTAKQAYLGLAGVIIVEDDEEKGLNLPSGKYDVPLFIQDKRLNSDNSINYNPDHDDIISGFLGNTVLVNGTPNAYLDVEKNLYRFRLINGSNARVYKIQFSDSRSFSVIGTDGGLLEKPEQLNSFNLSPAERVEIVVDFSGDALNSSVQLLSTAYEFDSIHRGNTYPQGMALTILDCRITTKGTSSIKIPASLVAYEKLTESSAVNTQTFILTMDHSKPSGMHMINGLVFDMNRMDIMIKQNDVEIWEIQNTGDGFHSMHIHGGQFQILERLYANPMTPVDFAWKDTVLIYPNETVRLLVRFKEYKGLYLLHCHTLEHEDDGMMLNIQVS